MMRRVKGAAHSLLGLRRSASLPFLPVLAALLGLLLSACAVARASDPVASATAPAALVETGPAQAAPSPAPTQTAAPAATPAVPAALPTEMASPSATPAPTACPPEACLVEGAFHFQRPVAPPGRDTPDHSYPYGSTQGGLRDPHHGVEFLNSQGTPVLAAAGGVVEVAGDDRTTFYGPYSYFYGNLVVIRHALPGVEEPVYTLYGHLSEIHAQVGQQVQAGEQIGLVGMTGVATGAHLHFEVRYGENLYQRTSNPELWLVPHTGEQGVPNGGVAVRVLDTAGAPAEVESAVVQRLSGPGGSSLGEVYPQVYEEKALLGAAPYGESFAAGDLEPGWYRVSFAYQGLQRREFEVRPGTLTLLTFQPSGGQP